LRRGSELKFKGKRLTRQIRTRLFRQELEGITKQEKARNQREKTLRRKKKLETSYS
jgi:hypothetical protein